MRSVFGERARFGRAGQLRFSLSALLVSSASVLALTTGAAMASDAPKIGAHPKAATAQASAESKSKARATAAANTITPIVTADAAPTAPPSTGAPVPAPAATGAPPAADSAAANDKVERVVVTAQKRKEQNIKVPIAVTSLGGERFKGVTGSYLTDLGNKVPNVILSYGSLSPGIIIRGISSQSGANAGFPPAVGVYVNDVYQGRDATFNTILSDIDRIEVLRGPQGTLYGKNTIAGTINIITHKPSNEFEAYGDVTFGNYDYFQARGTVSGAIVEDKLMVRITGAHAQRDGFLKNTFTGEDLNDLGANGGRITVVSNLSDKVSLEFGADYFRQSDTSALETGPLPPNPIYAPLAPQSFTDRVVQLNSPEFAERELYGVYGRLNWDLGGVALTSITSYGQFRTEFHDDSDGTPLDSFDVGREENSENFSDELRLTSNTEGPLSWILGFYYYGENTENIRNIHVGPVFDNVLLGANFGALFGPEAALTQSTIEGTSYAFFANGTWSLREDLRLEAGLRWTHEEKDFFYHQFKTLVTPVSLVGAFVVPIGPRTSSLDESEWTGDISLSYDFSKDATGYAKFSRGYKAGGFQTDVISPPSPPTIALEFNPEFVNNYEVGLKTYWYNDRLSLNIAAFYLDFSDKQEQVFTGTSFLISNAASATSKGIEIELLAKPLDGMTVDFNLGLLDAKYEHFPNAGGLGIDFDGNKLVAAPDTAGSFGVQYVTPFMSWSGVEFYARGDINYRGSLFTTTSNDPRLEQDAFTTIDARIGLQGDAGDWGIYLWGRNLGDETVLGGGNVFPFPAGTFTTRSINIDRTYGVELRKAF